MRRRIPAAPRPPVGMGLFFFLFFGGVSRWGCHPEGQVLCPVSPPPPPKGGRPWMCEDVSHNAPCYLRQAAPPPSEHGAGGGGHTKIPFSPSRMGGGSAEPPARWALQAPGVMAALRTARWRRCCPHPKGGEMGEEAMEGGGGARGRSWPWGGHGGGPQRVPRGSAVSARRGKMVPRVRRGAGRC